MSGVGHSPVHYEVFSKRTPQSSWTLQMASEQRTAAIEAAQEIIAARQACAVRVNKEMFDAKTGEFSSVTILAEGMAEPARQLKARSDIDSVCTSPQDFYNIHARDKIARLLDDWLKRSKVTPFELLHRPDLAERLEASGTELLHVVQKLAIVESQETGQDLHDLIRRWRALIDRATTRLIEDGRRKLFPDVDPGNWLQVIDHLAGHGERAYVLGGGLARFLAPEMAPAGKLKRLLPLGKLLGDNLEGREWALQVLEIPVSELFGAKSSLSDLLGYEADLGISMAVMTRMAAGDAVEALTRADPRVAKVMPPLPEALEGFHELMADDLFPSLSHNISKRLMTELKGPRRLHPGDAENEIETLRALALCLTAAEREEAQREDIKEAFAERSKMLVSADFVESLMALAKTAAEEVEKLIWLCENVVGAANKRQAARWLISALSGLKFEREMRDGKTPAGQRLQALAQLQRRVRKVQLVDKDADEACDKLGHVGGLIAEDVHLFAHALRNAASPVQKLGLLLGFACGQTAPLGPISEQARAEATKLLRAPDVRQGLMGNPQVMATLGPLIQAAGIAA